MRHFISSARSFEMLLGISKKAMIYMRQQIIHADDSCITHEFAFEQGAFNLKRSNDDVIGSIDDIVLAADLIKITILILASRVTCDVVGFIEL